MPLKPGSTAPTGSGNKRPKVAAGGRKARQIASASTVDLYAWLLAVQIVRDHVWLLLFGVAAVLLPAALAVQWTYQCSAWVNDGTARCRRPRAGFMRRCHNHGQATITLYDAAAALASLAAVINALVLISAFQH